MSENDYARTGLGRREVYVMTYVKPTLTIIGKFSELTFGLFSPVSDAPTYAGMIVENVE